MTLMIIKILKRITRVNSKIIRTRRIMVEINVIQQTVPYHADQVDFVGSCQVHTAKKSLFS